MLYIPAVPRETIPYLCIMSIMSTTLTTLILSNIYVTNIYFSTCAMRMCLRIRNQLKPFLKTLEVRDRHVMYSGGQARFARARLPPRNDERVARINGPPPPNNPIVSSSQRYLYCLYAFFAPPSSHGAAITQWRPRGDKPTRPFASHATRTQGHTH